MFCRVDFCSFSSSVPPTLQASRERGGSTRSSGPAGCGLLVGRGSMSRKATAARHMAAAAGCGTSSSRPPGPEPELESRRLRVRAAVWRRRGIRCKIKPQAFLQRLESRTSSTHTESGLGGPPFGPGHGGPRRMSAAGCLRGKTCSGVVAWWLGQFASSTARLLGTDCLRETTASLRVRGSAVQALPLRYGCQHPLSSGLRASGPPQEGARFAPRRFDSHNGGAWYFLAIR